MERGRKVFVVAQTTFHIDKFKLVLALFKKKGYHVSVINTIATQLSKGSQKQRN